MANKLNGIDVDKMDYIMRDGIGLGISTSFDWRYTGQSPVVSVV